MKNFNKLKNENILSEQFSLAVLNFKKILNLDLKIYKQFLKTYCNHGNGSNGVGVP